MGRGAGGRMSMVEKKKQLGRQRGMRGEDVAMEREPIEVSLN